MKKLAVLFLTLVMLVSMAAMTAVSAYADDGVKPTEFWCTVNEYASWSLNEREGYSVERILSVDGDLPYGMDTEIDNLGRLILSGTPYSVGDYKVTFALDVNDGNYSWGTGLSCIFHVENAKKDDYTLSPYYVTLDAGQKYWIPFDMDSAGFIDNYKLKDGNLPDGMYGDMDRNALYIAGTPVKSGTYDFTIAAHNSSFDCWVSQPIHITVTGNAAPVITKQPTGETIVEGSGNSFIARADYATKITWRFVSPDTKTTIKASDGPSYFAGLQVSGTDKEQLFISNVPLSLDGWSAEALFEGAGGSVYSKGAIIKVVKPELKNPVISDKIIDGKLNPGETVTLKDGETVTLIVNASSPDNNKLSYQWYKTEKNGNYGGTAIPGATSASLEVKYEEGTHYYYCMVYNNRDGEISSPLSSSAACVIGAPTPTPAPSAEPTPVPSAEPEEPAETPEEPAAPEKPEEKSEKADHTVAFIIGGVAAVALICATLIVIQRGVAKRYPDRYSEQIRRVDEYRESHRHIKK